MKSTACTLLLICSILILITGGNATNSIHREVISRPKKLAFVPDIIRSDARRKCRTCFRTILGENDLADTKNPTTNYDGFKQEVLTTSHNSHYMRKMEWNHGSLKLNTRRREENRLFIAPTIYLCYLIATLYLLCELINLNLPVKGTTLGFKTIALVTTGLSWDNFVISFGSIFCRDICSFNQTLKHTILKWLSYPRFTLHIVGIPLQSVAVAEMGKAANIGFLQSKNATIIVMLLSLGVAIADHVHFSRSSGIVLDTHKELPPNSLQRGLIKFTYKKRCFAYLIPALMFLMFSTIVGATAYITGKDIWLANWIFFSAVTAILGNAIPSRMTAFTGSLGEIGMQFCLIKAARIVYC